MDRHEQLRAWIRQNGNVSPRMHANSMACSGYRLLGVIWCIGIGLGVLNLHNLELYGPTSQLGSEAHVVFKKSRQEKSTPSPSEVDIAGLKPGQLVVTSSTIPTYDLTRTGAVDVPPLLQADLLNTSDCKRLSSLPWSESNRQLNVLLIVGTLQAVKQNAEKNGGPMGEVVFFTSVLQALLCSSHRVTVAREPGEIKRADLARFDIFLTERLWIGTAGSLKALGVVDRFPCRVRLLDFFGTSRSQVPFGLASRQILTPYPYASGNEFIGLVVKDHAGGNPIPWDLKDDAGLIWGKEPRYFDAPHVREALSALADLNVTLYVSINPNSLQSSGIKLPSNVVNQGVTTRSKFLQLLRRLKFVLGLGDPILGPTALEAIANGLAFINPLREPFFVGSNTDDLITSQHPYVAQTIGEPYVYTIQLREPAEVRKAVLKALHTSLEPHALPDMTLAAVAERLVRNMRDKSACDF